MVPRGVYLVRGRVRVRVRGRGRGRGRVMTMQEGMVESMVPRGVYVNIYTPYTASGSSASQKPTKREVCRVYTRGMGVLKMLGRLRGSGEGWG